MITLGMLAPHEGPPPRYPYSYRNSYVDATNLTIYTFAACDFGVAHSKRLVIVGIHGTNQYASSVTIGGVAATFVVSSVTAGRPCEIWCALVPTGTTGTIAVTFAAACTSAAIHVWVGYPASATPIDAVGLQSNNATTTASDVAKNSGGFTIATGYAAAGTITSLTQNGNETIIQRYNSAASGATVAAWDHANDINDSTLDDYTQTLSGAAVNAICVASWGAQINVGFTFDTHIASSSALSTYTFAAQPIGPASPTRTVIVGICCRIGAGSPAISSVTIGGVAATLVVELANGADYAGLYSAVVPTGITASVVVNWAVGVARCGIGLWSVYDLKSQTPTSTQTSTANPGSVTISAPTKGVIIAYEYSAASAAPVVWAGTAGLLSNFDANEVSSNGHSGASATYEVAAAGLTITCTRTANLVPSMVVAAFN